MNETKKAQKEIDVLHSAVIAIEEILIKKKIVKIKELNQAIKKAHKECKIARKKGRQLKLS